MKKTLMVLLCLLSGCKELENSKTEGPVICTAAAFLPINEISVVNLTKRSNYEIWINNQVLWNSCSQTSKFAITSLRIGADPLSEKFQLHFNLIVKLVQENSLAEVKLYRTDVLCNIDPDSEVIRRVQPTFNTHKYGDENCDYYTNSSSLYVDFGESTESE